MSEYARWTMQSSQRWPQLAQAIEEQTGIDVCFRRPGGLHLLLSEREVENRANALKRLHNQPGMERFDYQILDHGEVEKMLPQIGPRSRGQASVPPTVM